MNLIVPYDTAHGIVQRKPCSPDKGIQFIVSLDNNVKLPATPFNLAIYPANVTPLAVSAEITRVLLVRDSGVGTKIIIVKRQSEGDVRRFINVGDQVLCGVTFADLLAVEAASNPVASAEKLSIPDGTGWLHNDGRGNLVWSAPISTVMSSVQGCIIKHVKIENSPEVFTTNVGKLLRTGKAIPSINVSSDNITIIANASAYQDARIYQVGSPVQAGSNMTFSLTIGDGSMASPDGSIYVDIIIMKEELV
jgi:hypothetical protein